MRPPIDLSPDRLKVIDVGSFIAGPFAATLLGDLGAEVIKIERPGVGDAVRHIGPGEAGMSYLWTVEGRNKRSVAIELGHPAGQDLVRSLVGWADVLIENFRPGTMASWGLGYEDLSAINPRLVFVSVSGFGQDGPYAGKAGIDRVGTAFGGLTFVTGYPDSAPVRPGYAVADYMTGAFAAIGALEAVRRRDARGVDGRGEWVDLGLYEPLIRFSEFSIPHYLRDGVVRERMGNLSASSSPSDAYRTADGQWVIVAAPSDSLFTRLAQTIGRPDMLDDPGFATAPERTRRSEVIDGAVAAWVAQRPRHEVLAVFEAAGVPVSPINSVADIAADPQVAARGNIVTVPDHAGRPFPMQGVVPTFRTEPTPIRWAGEPLGASTGQVLGELAGLSTEDVIRLIDEGVLGGESAATTGGTR